MPVVAALAALVVVHTLIDLTAAQQAQTPECESCRGKTFVEVMSTPRILADLHTFMGLPIDTIVFFQAAYEMGDLSTTEDFRRWTYAQVLAEEDRSALANTTSAINMHYVGLNDGRFIGYYDSF